MDPRKAYSVALEALEKGYLDASCETLFEAAVEAVREIAESLGEPCRECSPEEIFTVLMKLDPKLKALRLWESAMVILNCDMPPNVIRRLSDDVLRLIEIADSMKRKA